MRPLLPEESAQISESAVLDNEIQFAPGNPLGAGAEQIDNVQVRAEVTENFQFANQRFDCDVTGGAAEQGTNDFNCHFCNRLIVIQTDGIGF